MNSDLLLVVLTENCWLYKGLKSLLPEIVCLQTGFCAQSLPREVSDARRIIIAVDSLIVLQGEWGMFNALLARRSDATVVWLTRRDTGRLFPALSRVDKIVDQQQRVVSLHCALGQTPQWEWPLREGERVTGNGLTLTELHLLPLLVSGVSIPTLSRLMGKSVKTIYTHRRNILAKMGFRKLAFLQFVCKRNRGKLGIF